MSLARPILQALAPVLLIGCTAFDDVVETNLSGFQADGTYALSQSELARDCSRLSASAAVHLGEMQKHVNAERQARKAVPRTVVSLVTRSLGADTSDSVHVQRFKRDYAIVAAINSTLAERDCATVDIASAVGSDAELMGVDIR